MVNKDTDSGLPVSERKKYGKNNRGRRIVISGTFGVGKSTTTKLLSLMTGLPVLISPQMRDLLPRMFPGKTLRECTPHELYQMFLTRFVERKAKEEKYDGGFISDGSPLNEWAYLASRLVHGAHGPVTRVTDEGYRFAVTALEEVVKRHTLSGYDDIVHLPPEFPLPHDGHRPVSDDFRNHADNLIKNAFRELGFELHAATGTPEERARRIAELLGLDISATLTEGQKKGNTVWFERIEDALGDREGRYFSSGFKKVRHYIYDVTVDRGNKRIFAKADVVCPSDWSVKSNRNQKPHLANVDVLLIMGQLAQLLLCSMDKIERSESNTMWVRNVHIINLKPVEQLEGMTFELEEKETYYHCQNGECWHLGVMKGRVSGDAVKINDYRVCYKLPPPLQGQHSKGGN